MSVRFFDSHKRKEKRGFANLFSLFSCKHIPLILFTGAFALSACGGLPAPREAESVIPSPVAFVTPAPLPEATATPTLAPLPTPTTAPATPVPKQLPQESTATIGLWSDRVSDVNFPGFLDIAQGAAANEIKQQRNPLMVTLGAEQVHAAPASQLEDLRANRSNWLLFDRQRRVVMSSADNTAPLLDIRNADVRNQLAENVAKVISDTNAQGVVLNNVGVDLIRPTNTPIFTGTRAFTADQRRDAVDGLLRAIRARVQDKLIIVGGYLWEDGTAFDANTQSARDLSANADGVHIDEFMRSPISKTNEFRSEAAWKRDVDYLSTISQDDRVVLITTRLNASETPTETVRQWLNYSVASYLLGKNGKHTYFQFDAGDPAFSADPILSAPIGAPSDAYNKLDSGIYQRKFTKGVVLVNPTADEKTWKVDQPYKSLAGNPVDTEVTLGPRSGLILLNP
jgi:hypothetical protein